VHRIVEECEERLEEEEIEALLALVQECLPGKEVEVGEMEEGAEDEGEGAEAGAEADGEEDGEEGAEAMEDEEVDGMIEEKRDYAADDLGEAGEEEM
jgi:hypothetical protein